MAVYVDPLGPCVPNRKWRWDRSCHLTADTEVELHEFAARIGLIRAWFQNRQDCPHYDLTRGMRAQAVKGGAVEEDGNSFVGRIRARRRKRQKEKG